MVEALREHFPAQASWTEPQGGLFIWATLPEYIDTSDLLAKALREDVAFVPGQAAFVDESRGRNSMRLNFSGVGEEEIREGVRRIGKAIAEQVDFYHALTVEKGSEDSPGMPGREAEDMPVDVKAKPSSGPGHDLIPPGPDEGAVLPFRRKESA